VVEFWRHLTLRAIFLFRVRPHSVSEIVTRRAAIAVKTSPYLSDRGVGSIFHARSNALRAYRCVFVMSLFPWVSWESRGSGND